MAEGTMLKVSRISPLEGVARPGRYGATGDGGPGVKLAVRSGLSIVSIIARKDKSKALSQMMETHYGAACPAAGYSATGEGVSMHWSGAEQWFIIAGKREDGELYEDLAKQLAGLASVSDQSHGRIIIAVSGPHAGDVLAKGTPVDLHASVFGEGRCAMTRMAHTGVHISRVGPDAFELSLFRGFGISFWEWLMLMSREFGYEVS